MSRPARGPRADVAVRQWRVGLMADVLIAPMAEADTADMRRHIAADSRPAADRPIRRISDMFDGLAASPERGIRFDSVCTGLRCKTVKRSYLVFYEVVDGV